MAEGAESYEVPIAISPASNAGGPFSAGTVIQFGNGLLEVPNDQVYTPTTTATATAALGPASGSSNVGTGGAGSAASSSTHLIIGAVVVLAAGVGIWYFNR